MNKDDILEKSRRENQGPDEMEQYVMAAAGKIAAKVGMLVCCIAAILQVIFTDAISFESWMIYFSILATTFTVSTNYGLQSFILCCLSCLPYCF